MRLAFILAVTSLLTGCGLFTDPATRLAYDLEAAEDRLGSSNGATYRLEHETPSSAGQCVGPYTVQLDQVGAIIVWCRDAAGATVSSHSTSYHRRFVDTPRTYIVEKAAAETLVIELERRGGRAVITDAR